MRTGLPVQTGIVCDFRQIGHAATPWEQDAALKTFEFNGLAIGEDPLRRLGYYDTDIAAQQFGWDADTKKLVEDRLLSGASYGIDYLRVEKPKLPAPWPTYDTLVQQGRRTNQMVAEKIAETVADIGIDPQVVINYERENLGREEVIKAVEVLLEPKPAEEIVAA